MNRGGNTLIKGHKVCELNADEDCHETFISHSGANVSRLSTDYIALGIDHSRRPN
jgi:hypothetical protein